jgi:hypothetical protein
MTSRRQHERQRTADNRRDAIAELIDCREQFDGRFSSATSIRHASTATSCVADASAAITAKIANVPMLVAGLVAASPANAAIITAWQSTIQLFPPAQAIQKRQAVAVDQRRPEELE